MTSINSLSVADLPAALAALALAAAGRSKVFSVSIDFSTALASVSFGWRADDAVTLGELMHRKTNNWTGSDGESNVTVTDSYSAPVAVARKLQRSGVAVAISVGNLTPEQLEQLSAALFSMRSHGERRADVLGLLPVLVDASLSQQPQTDSTVALVETFDHRTTGGESGIRESIEVERSTVNAQARKLEAKPAKAPKARRSTTFSSVVAAAEAHHVDAMAAAGWLS